MNTRENMEKANSLLKQIENLDRKYSAKENFDDIIDWGILWIGSGIRGRMPESAEEMLNRLRQKHSDTVLKEIHQIMMEILDLVRRTKCDILGHIYMNLGSNRNLSQVFTPDFLSETVALLITDTFYPGMKVHDPCCGSGSISLGTLRAIEKKGNDYHSVIIVGTDIDMRCVKMATLQLQAVGACAKIYCLDSLKEPITENFDSSDKYFFETSLYTAIKKLNELDCIKNVEEVMKKEAENNEKLTANRKLA